MTSRHLAAAGCLMVLAQGGGQDSIFYFSPSRANRSRHQSIIENRDTTPRNRPHGTFADRQGKRLPAAASAVRAPAGSAAVESPTAATAESA